MKYLIVQDWSSTHGNHAGMVHMCKLLSDRYDDYETYIMPIPLSWHAPSGTFWVRCVKKIFLSVFFLIYRRLYYPYKYKKICKPMFNKLKEGDKVFLLEYLLPQVSQFELAIYIRKRYKGVKLYALSHLTVKYFDEVLLPKDSIIIQEWAAPVDKMLTLGSSLSSYFINKGVDRNKISTGFHYVDSNYYRRISNFEPADSKKLTIVTMGALQRDYSLLSEVVNSTRNVNWIICRGKNNKVDTLFDKTDNVLLEGFLTEDELKNRMELADISLNLMEDTVGSNVITTSMAMGLAMIVTDVGSIHDYCDDSNALFCKHDLMSIKDCINMLDDNRSLLQSMKISSLHKASKFCISDINDWFCSL